MPAITIGGEELFYQERGERDREPTVLFLHGAGGTWRHWGLQLRDLEGTHRMALDLPGHGRSGGAGRRTIEGYADVVAQFIEALDCGALAVIGHSMGGAITLMLAVVMPDQVAQVGVVGAGSRLPVRADFLEGFLAPDPAPAVRAIARQMYRPTAAEAQVGQAARELGAIDREVYYGDLTACNAFDLTGRVGTIYQPALVLVGAEDRMVPPRYARSLAERLQNATFQIVPDAGHMVMLEQPEAVTETLRDFLGM